MSCGAWCVYYRDKPEGVCGNCSYFRDGVKPKFDLGRVDAFELARLLREKREKEERKTYG